MSTSVLAYPGHIYTFAGGGIGDGGPATLAPLGPGDIALDLEGNLVISDASNHRIRQVDARTGIISTIAGTGIRGWSGDGGSALAARLDTPGGLAIDATGAIYVSAGDRVRKITPDGIITTVAGNGDTGFSGDGGSAIEASLNHPTDLALDSEGNLYIADTLNDRIRKVNTSGAISTFAGGGSYVYNGDGLPATMASLALPSGIATDLSGGLFIADTLRSRIRVVNELGIISTFAGRGSRTGEDLLPMHTVPALAAGLYLPAGVAADPYGNVFVSDTGNDQVRKVDTFRVATTIAGNGREGFGGDGGLAVDATLNVPTDLLADSRGAVYFIDAGNNRVRRVSPVGVIDTVAGNGSRHYCCDGSPAIGAGLDMPARLAVDEQGSVYIADNADHRVRKVDTDGVIATFAGTGKPGFTGDGESAVTADLNAPTAVALDDQGNVYIADSENHRVRKVDPAGTITTVAGSGTRGYAGDGGPATEARFSHPEDVAVGPDGRLYVSDWGNGRIRMVDSDGVVSTIAGTGCGICEIGDGGPAVEASLSSPAGLGLDASGVLYIADSGHDRVRIVDRDGIISTLAGTGEDGFSGDGGSATAARLSGPYEIVATDEGVYITDGGNDRVRVVTGGIIHTIVGNGESEYGGDDGPALSASINPAGLAFDKSGNLLVAGNHRVRIVRAGIA